MTSRIPLMMAFSVGAILCTSGAMAQTITKFPEQTREAARPAANAAVQPSESTVFVDPETKQIRPPKAGELGALTGSVQQRIKAAPRAPAVVIYGPGLAFGILLDDSFMNSMVATKKSDGTLAMECLTGDNEREKLSVR